MIVLLDAAAPGMVAKTAIVDARGLMLAPAGAVLSEAMLRQLRARDIASVEIQEPAAEPDVLQAKRRAEKQKFVARFANLPRTPALVQLERLTLERYADA